MLTLWDIKLKLMNLPPLQGPVTVFSLFWRISPFTFWVEVQVAMRVTPPKSRWSEMVKKS